METIQDLTKEFFKQRFPYKNIEEEQSYFEEWDNRIKYGLIWGLKRLDGIADSESMKILERLFKEFRGEKKQ